MSARYRGKLGKLRKDDRMLVIEALLDGREYDDIRATLRDRGYTDREIPAGSRGFAAYMESDEFLAARATWLHARDRAASKALIGRAIQSGADLCGIADAAAGLILMRIVDEAADDERDPARLANAIAALKRTLLADERERHRQELAGKATEVEKAATETGLTEQEKRQRIRELLGLA